ncbi:hypothetical protein WJR50_32310 [Catalinimonas sp. 4WD22]|uniref:hypothetical protein n=1 Tax=Catalinimonas locisalis TaxID=3133978 RepID=UPI00310172BC
MKSFREDLLLSKLIQLSLIGTLLIVGILLMSQEYDALIPIKISDEVQKLQITEEADSLLQAEPSSWFRNSIDWIDTHLPEPVRTWK